MSRIKARLKYKVMPILLITDSYVMEHVTNNTGEKYIIHFIGLSLVLIYLHQSLQNIDYYLL